MIAFATKEKEPQVQIVERKKCWAAFCNKKATHVGVVTDGTVKDGIPFCKEHAEFYKEDFEIHKIV